MKGVILEALSISGLITGYIQFFIGNWNLKNKSKNIWGLISFTIVFVSTFFLIKYNTFISESVNNKYIVGSIVVGITLMIMNFVIVNMKIKSLKKTWSENPSKSILINLTNDLRFYSLEKEKSPNLNEALQIYLDTIIRILGKWEGSSSRKGIYKVCVARPVSKGKFEFVGFRNIPSERLNSFRMEANWEEQKKVRKSLFAKGVHQEELFVRTTSKNSKDYKNFTEPPNYKPSKVHMIIPLKSDLYKKDKMIVTDCLAVLTISATEMRMLPEEDDVGIYNQLRPVVKGIEAIYFWKT